MMLRLLFIAAALLWPIDTEAACKVTKSGARIGCGPVVSAPATRVTPRPKVTPATPPRLKLPDRGGPSGDVTAIPQLQAPQPPAQAPGLRRVPRAVAGAGASGTVMRKYTCQASGTWCNLNSFEVYESGSTCHCRGNVGKIK